MFGGRWERYQTAGESTRARAKLADVRYHDLRHTFASWAVQRRVSLLELATYSGTAPCRWSSGTATSHLSTFVRQRRPSKVFSLARRQQTEPSRSSRWVRFVKELLDLVGSPGWARTSDFLINSQALYQLSYRGTS